MKLYLIGCAILATCFSGASLASSCSDPQITGTALSNLITNSTVCANLGDDKWQEQHRSGGELWDYKLGPTDPIDPTKKVGTWSILTRSNQVQYNYSSGSYAYAVRGPDAGGKYSFCSTAVQIHNVTLKPGITSCP